MKYDNGQFKASIAWSSIDTLEILMAFPNDEIIVLCRTPPRGILGARRLILP